LGSFKFQQKALLGRGFLDLSWDSYPIALSGALKKIFGSHYCSGPGCLPVVHLTKGGGERRKGEERGLNYNTVFLLFKYKYFANDTFLFFFLLRL
jgi:hypothetical protein